MATVYYACINGIAREHVAMVDRSKRPSIEELENYTPRYEDDDVDYTGYELQLLSWLSDHRRDEEQERKMKLGAPQPLPGHEKFKGSGVHGFKDVEDDTLLDDLQKQARPV